MNSCAVDIVTFDCLLFSLARLCSSIALPASGLLPLMAKAGEHRQEGREGTEKESTSL
jgi:hypothetical protein